ncbi:hypothetical protein AVEN_265007-1 [Araneus ventricosus]|uniref:Reverse transcriptase domain-containing protein n=1 Tax=Araneus ventricosus TaxID=182803 RepID=A0A4Y2ERN2_ARAVE|nr:hypothetical protein AVEN_265007-1 [Araneus ventricosus]
MSTGESNKAIEDLNCYLEQLGKWLIMWKIKDNADKCQAVYFTRRRKATGSKNHRTFTHAPGVFIFIKIWRKCRQNGSETSRGLLRRTRSPDDFKTEFLLTPHLVTFGLRESRLQKSIAKASHLLIPQESQMLIILSANI